MNSAQAAAQIVARIQRETSPREQPTGINWQRERAMIEEWLTKNEHHEVEPDDLDRLYVRFCYHGAKGIPT